MGHTGDQHTDEPPHGERANAQRKGRGADEVPALPAPGPDGPALDLAGLAEIPGAGHNLLTLHTWRPVTAVLPIGLTPNGTTCPRSVGLQFGYMLGGAALVEVVFAWPGLGRYVIQSIATRDYPADPGAVLVVAAGYVLINVLVDLAYALLDPRVRHAA